MEEYIGDEAISYFPWTPATSYISGSSSQEFFIHLYGDLFEARWYILGFGFGVSLVVSLIYMGLLRIPCLLTFVVWGSIGMVIALFAGMWKRCKKIENNRFLPDINKCISSPTMLRPNSLLFTLVVGYYAYTTATEWSQMDKPPVRLDQIDYTFYGSYICMAIAALLLLMAICLRASIQLAITCVQNGGAAINSMTLLLLVPFLQVCGFLAL
jgi:hypothetical protein